MNNTRRTTTTRNNKNEKLVQEHFFIEVNPTTDSEEIGQWGFETRSNSSTGTDTIQKTSSVNRVVKSENGTFFFIFEYKSNPGITHPDREGSFLRKFPTSSPKHNYELHGHKRMTNCCCYINDNGLYTQKEKYQVSFLKETRNFVCLKKKKRVNAQSI